MMDLLGSDLPVQGENGIEFSWSDGILLQVMSHLNFSLQRLVFPVLKIIICFNFLIV